ncbi:MAG: hypothetical protein HY697_04215 [Deltaproteobacteria bacterium]|nr:hypothetical protein [Deltaproteobacteria bacterium]
MRKFWTVSISLLALGILALGPAYGQAPKKVGGGDIKFEAPGSAGPVTYSHERHVQQQKLKCTDCHTKIFKMKKGEMKLTKADHAKPVFCGTCHNGKKVFSQTSEADCAKCHKK